MMIMSTKECVSCEQTFKSLCLELVFYYYLSYEYFSEEPRILKIEEKAESSVVALL